MDEITHPPISVDADHANVGVTANGDVVFQMRMKPPPEGFGKACPVIGCGAMNWPHARYCRDCCYDFRERRRLLIVSAVIGLLVLIATVALLGLQRI